MSVKLGFSAIAAAALLFTAACSQEQGAESRPEAPTPTLAPALAPAYEATTPDGELVSLASLHGEAVLLNVWATWCGPCRIEIPYFAKLHAAESAKGLRVIGVSIDAAEDRQKVLDLAPTLGLTYDIWLDPDQRISAILGSPGVPATLLIDRAGAVLWKHDGAVDENTPGFRDALTQVLQQ